MVSVCMITYNHAPYIRQAIERILTDARDGIPVRITDRTGLPSSSPDNLPHAHRMADSVICLPMYAGLQQDDIDQLLNSICSK